MDPLDPHEVLGVAAEADRDEIRRAYLRRLRRHHPDSSTEPGPTEDLDAVRAAYRRLLGSPSVDVPVPSPPATATDDAARRSAQAATSSPAAGTRGPRSARPDQPLLRVGPVVRHTGR